MKLNELIDLLLENKLISEEYSEKLLSDLHKYQTHESFSNFSCMKKLGELIKNQSLIIKLMQKQEVCLDQFLNLGPFHQPNILELLQSEYLIKYLSLNSPNPGNQLTIEQVLKLNSEQLINIKLLSKEYLQKLIDKTQINIENQLTIHEILNFDWKRRDTIELLLESEFIRKLIDEGKTTISQILKLTTEDFLQLKCLPKYCHSNQFIIRSSIM